MDDSAHRADARQSAPVLPPHGGRLAGRARGRAARRDCLRRPGHPDRSLIELGRRLGRGPRAGAPRAEAGTYAEAGIEAWTVWVPAADERSAGLLADAGHLIDADPAVMCMELEQFDLPARRPRPRGGARGRDLHGAQRPRLRVRDARLRDGDPRDARGRVPRRARQRRAGRVRGRTRSRWRLPISFQRHVSPRRAATGLRAS